jgi:hypothetical protein
MRCHSEPGIAEFWKDAAADHAFANVSDEWTDKLHRAYIHQYYIRMPNMYKRKRHIEYGIDLIPAFGALQNADIKEIGFRKVKGDLPE